MDTTVQERKLSSHQSGETDTYIRKNLIKNLKSDFLAKRIYLLTWSSAQNVKKGFPIRRWNSTLDEKTQETSFITL